MTIPYHARIVGQLAGHTEIELCRFHRRICPKDFRHATNHLSSDWTFWLEQPLRDSQTLTERPHTGRRHGPIPAPKLTPEQHASLEVAGVVPTYKAGDEQ